MVTGWLAIVNLLLALTTNLASSALPDELAILKNPAVAWGLFLGLSAIFFVLQLVERRRAGRQSRAVSSAIPRGPTNLILREEETQILEQLASPNAFVSLLGPPGIGKTVLASRVATAIQRNPDWQVIWWFDASSYAEVEKYVLRLGRALSYVSPTHTSVEKVKDQLSSYDQEVLLVLDGVADYAHLEDIIPSGKTIRILATGRLSSGLPSDRAIMVGPLRAESAARLLQESGDGTVEEARELAGALGCHVLPVSQAAAYIRTRGITIGDYIKQLADVHVPLQKSFPGSTKALDVVVAFTQGLNDLMRPDSNSSYQPISDKLVDAFMALGDCTVSHAFLAKVCLLPQEDVRLSIRRLERAGLLRAAHADSSGASTVAWRTLLLLRGDFVDDALQRILASIEQVTEEVSFRNLLPECVRLLHDLSLAAHLQKLGTWDSISSGSVLNIVDKLYSAGDYKSMLAVGSSALHRTIESDAPGVAKVQAMKRLAHAYLAAGNGPGAVRLYEESLQSLVALHERDAPEVLETRVELGHAFRSAGKSKSAIEEFEQVLMYLKNAPNESLETNAKAGLGFAHLYAKNYEIAIELMEAVWRIRRQRLGPNAWSTLAVQTNLGRAYLDYGKTKKARRLLEDAETRRKNELGEDNPHTLVTSFHLGRAWRKLGWEAMGRHKIAEVARLRTEVLGPGHPDTISADSELLD
ncbi:MAG: hypothetical protein JWM42_800 [Burkholderia sp.]|nr:hypothetical protein [Burkholderia sp.]